MLNVIYHLYVVPKRQNISPCCVSPVALHNAQGTRPCCVLFIALHGVQEATYLNVALRRLLLCIDTIRKGQRDCSAGIFVSVEFFPADFSRGTPHPGGVFAVRCPRVSPSLKTPIKH